MSCKHGNWSDCEVCQEVEEAYARGLAAGKAEPQHMTDTPTSENIKLWAKEAGFEYDPRDCNFYGPDSAQWINLEIRRLANRAYAEGHAAALRAALTEQPPCWCHKCNEGRAVNGIPFSLTRMILCPDCGNKRCPKASNHEFACTVSNQPGQIGTLAEQPAVPAPVVLTEERMRELVKECGLDWQRGYVPLFGGDPTNRYAVLIEATIAAAIPPGYCVVPVEPSEMMVTSGIEAGLTQYESAVQAALSDGPEPQYKTSAEAIYRAMIAARPGEKHE